MTDQRLTLAPLARTGKIRNLSERAAGADPASRVSIIAKVRTADYTPTTVTLRTRLDPHLFTAECSLQELHRLADDPNVESIEVTQALGLTEPATRTD